MVNQFGNTPLEREPYSWRAITDDKVFIYYETRLLAILREKEAEKFVKKIAKLEGLKAQKFLEKTAEEAVGVA